MLSGPDSSQGGIFIFLFSIVWVIFCSGLIAGKFSRLQIWGIIAFVILIITNFIYIHIEDYRDKKFRRVDVTVFVLNQVRQAIDTYHSELSCLPDHHSLYDNLMQNSHSAARVAGLLNEESYSRRRLLDLWGNELVYRLHSRGTDFEIYSSGPNGIDEGGRADDVRPCTPSGIFR
ncbi:MAG: type II secretion system protein GspG [Planctomycetes bacterium]|nr:type II secretion system protein GspG [Planctomycetota bacterium]